MRFFVEKFVLEIERSSIRQGIRSASKTANVTVMMRTLLKLQSFMLNLEYLADSNGQPKAVVIPIELWRKIFPQTKASLTPDELTDSIEDYCLHQAMTEAAQTPLLDRADALAYLETLPE